MVKFTSDQNSYCSCRASRAHNRTACAARPRMALPKLREWAVLKVKKQKFEKSQHQRRVSTARFNAEAHAIVKMDQISCSICYEILVGPVLTECGHIFCLHCLDQSFFLNEQCPLCRNQLKDESFQCSKQLTTLIDKHITHNLSTQEHKEYSKRVREFQIIERKRKLPSFIKSGDFVDFNVNQKWVSAQIKGKYNTFMMLQPIIGGSPSQKIKVDINSRRIATQYTFTKLPPLKPTYFTRNFNYHQPVLRYIVEPPTIVRRVPRREENLFINPIEEWRDWDYLGPIVPELDNWLSDDLQMQFPLDFQSPDLDENELLVRN